MAEVGILSRHLRGSNAQVTPHLKNITLGKPLRKGYPGLRLHRRHRGLDMKGKSRPVKAMDLLMSRLKYLK